jgi:HlyD family secretion protein
MNQVSRDDTEAVERLLASEGSAKLRGRGPFWVAAALVAMAVLGLAVVLLRADQQGVTRFKTAEAYRGDLTVKVTATGTLQPVNQVDVGTEISGTIESVEVDYNQRVRAGDVLARLNTDRLQALVVQARASLESANAKLREAGATVAETRVRAARCAKLAEQQLCSQEELDTAEAAYSRARAAEASARAQVSVAKATLSAQETDLAKAVIHAPISGIVLKREIEPGQTVAATLQTPVLFQLAENLTQMELHVAVDEADVGQVAEGQQASFTVDAYPNRAFAAVITQVRFAPETVEGVVTYGAVLSVDNADLALRPGMTATAEIISRQLSDVLLVPNAALRFAPPASETGARREKRSLFSRLFPRPPSPAKEKGTTGDERQRGVWTLREGVPVAIPVEIGPTDGLVTQVVSGKIAPGTPLLVDVVESGR